MLNKENWKKQLKADPTDWLLEEGDPAVRYLTLRDIVDADEKEIKTARTKAHREGHIATILDNMNPEGYWVRPGAGYSPKYQGTVWSLISLAELGASIEEDERLVRACSYYLDHAFAKGGQITPRGNPIATAGCLQGNMLTSLMDMGVRDSRLDAAYEWMARIAIFDDLPRRLNADGLDALEGGPKPFHYLTRFGPQFACRTNKYLPCGWAGIKIMLAFSRLPVEGRSSLINKAIVIGEEFFLSVDPSTAGFPGHRTGVPDERWWKFQFPMTGMDLLQVAEALAALGYGTDPRLANTLDLIRSKQDEYGRWLREKNYGYWHKWWVDYGPYNKPNKWVTLRAMRVLKQAGKSM